MTDLHCPVLGDEVGLPIYVLIAGTRDKEGHCVCKDGYPNHQIIYCTSGSGVLKVADDEYLVEAGDVMYIPSNVPHEYYPTETIWELHWLVFDGKDVGSIMQHCKLVKAKLVHINDLSSLETIFKKILYSMRTNYYCGGFDRSSLMYSFLIELSKLMYLQENTHYNQQLKQLKPVLDYINANYQREITLPELANIINITPQYLCRIFKNCLNVRPVEYIVKKRIQQAKILLVEDKLNVAEISLKVGYNDCSYFCAIFKKHESLSPAEFRSLHRNANKQS